MLIGGRCMTGDQDSKEPSGPAAKPPHYLGHRERFLKGGSDALADYELLEES